MKRAACRPQPVRTRKRLGQLLLAAALLLGTAAAGSGCAVHAHARPFPLPVLAVRVSPPPPPVERCTTQRMCNIWGVCQTRVICRHY